MADINIQERVLNSSGTYDNVYPKTKANLVTYTNTTSGLTATDNQGAIDELQGNKAFKETPTLSVTASKTLVLTDRALLQMCNSSSAMSITIPTNASVAFAIGTEIAFCRYGAGTVTFAGASGVTIRSVDSKLTISKQYQLATIKKIGTDEWILFGALG